MTAGEFSGTLIALILLIALSASLFFTLIDLCRKNKPKPDRREKSETLYTCSVECETIIYLRVLPIIRGGSYDTETKTSGED